MTWLTKKASHKLRGCRKWRNGTRISNRIHYGIKMYKFDKIC